jgi:flagellar basal body rod protein FlgG
MYASVSGLHAARTVLDVSAHNIANVSTAGFRPQRAELRALEPRSGVAATVTQEPEAPTAPGISGTDLPLEAVNVFVARHTYAANAQMLNVLSARDRYLLDLLA